MSNKSSPKRKTTGRQHTRAANADLAPDQRAIQRHIDAIFCRAEKGTYAQFRTFSDDKTNKVGKGFAVKIGTSRHNLSKKAYALAQWAAQQHRPFVVCQPSATFKDAANAKEVNLANGLAITIDLDTEPVQGLKQIRGVLGEPTMTVKSGGTFRSEDGRKEPTMHAIYRLAKPTRSAAEHALLKECLRMATEIAGGDGTNTSTVHALRTAGSVHRKNPKKPKLARIAEFNPDRELHLTAAHRKLTAALGKVSKGSRAKSPGKPTTAERAPTTERSTTAPTKAILTGSDYHGPLVQLAMHYILAGVSETSVIDVLRGHMEAVPGSVRDKKGGKVIEGRWQSRYDDIPAIVASAVAKADSDEGWLEPESLPTSLPPVPVMKASMLPKRLRPFLVTIAERMQVPLEYSAIPAVAAAGAALGRKVGVQPDGNDPDWIEVANQWACIIGDPGVLKSPSTQLALSPLQAREDEAQRANAKLDDDYRQKLAAFELRRKALEGQARKVLHNKPKANISKYLPMPPARPRKTRHIVVDATPESLGIILADNPSGVLVNRDELVPFLRTLENDNKSSERGMFLSGWGGHTKQTYDRVARGHVDSGAMCISLIGTAQPRRWMQYVQGVMSGKDKDDGMIQRFGLLVWPDVRPEWEKVDVAHDPKQAARVNATFKRLVNLDASSIGAKVGPKGLPSIKFSSAAQASFNQWHANLERRLRSGRLHPALQAHFGKYRTLVPSLALLFHLIDNEKGGPITLDAFKLAKWWAKHLEAHACRVYGGAMRTDVEGAKVILDKIKQGKLKGPFSERDIQRKEWSKLTDQNVIKQALQVLWDCNVVRRKGTGRAIKFDINPKLKRDAKS